jgi:hypothetical protein
VLFLKSDLRFVVAVKQAVELMRDGCKNEIGE